MAANVNNSGDSLRARPIFDLLKIIQSSKADARDQALKDLIEIYRPKVARMIKKFGVSLSDRDDLMQVGLKAVFENSFTAIDANNLRDNVYRALRAELDFLRVSDKNVSFPVPLEPEQLRKVEGLPESLLPHEVDADGLDPTRGIQFVSRSNDANPDLGTSDLLDRIAADCWDERQLLIALAHAEGATFEEIGSALELTHQRVSAIESRAYGMVRGRLTKEPGYLDDTTFPMFEKPTFPYSTWDSDTAVINTTPGNRPTGPVIG